MSDPAALQAAPKFTSRFMQVGVAEVCKLPPPAPCHSHRRAPCKMLPVANCHSGS